LTRNFGYKGTPIYILKSFLEKEGEGIFLENIRYAKYVGEERAKRIMSFVKAQIVKEGKKGIPTT